MGELRGTAPTGMQNRVIYLDFLRIVSMIAVITLHTAASNWYTDDVHTFAWRTFNFYDSIVRWGVPVFTMISGALFLSPARQISIETIYKKYIFRIVLAFLAWSSFYALFSFLKNRDVISALGQIISGHYHLWFLFMLVGLYIIVPLLRCITANRDATRYFLLVSFVFTFLIPLLMLGIKCLDTLRGGGSALYDFVNSVYGNVNFHFALGYSFYFVLGHYLNTTEVKRRLEILLYIFGAGGFIATILLSKALSFYLNSPNGTFYGNMTVNVMLESLSVFVLAKNRIPQLLKSKKVKTIVGKLSKYSFGVYLVHVFFIETLARLGLNTLTFSPALSVIVIVVAVFFLSLGVSIVLNHIPIVKKYLV